MSSPAPQRFAMLPYAAPETQRPLVSFEFFPPKTAEMEARLWDAVTGKELAGIGTPDVPLFIDTVKNGRVFARVTPLQKLRWTRARQWQSKEISIK